RLNRVAVVGSVFLLAAPYGIGIISFIANRTDYYVPPASPWQEVRLIAVTCGGFGLMVTVFLAAIFGGIAFAQERRDRSADFLAMLPTSRRQIVISKFI